VPLLHRLARTAAPGSDESVFAHRHLAELIAGRHPWRAALYARRVVSERPDDDRAWAVLALCQTLLGNYRYAAASYQRALACAPKNPWYAHNLGHLLDVALRRPNEALFWLKTAAAGAPNHSEIATSLAHALACAGKIGEAKKVLARAMKRSASREQAALWRWLEQGAPPGKTQPSPRSSRFVVPLSSDPWSTDADSLEEQAQSVAPSSRPRARPSQPSRGATTRAQRAQVRILHGELDRGLENLPLGPRQRARARALAREVVLRSLADVADPSGAPSVAAAIAYAIVFVDHVPLTQAEVAAPFRVSVARLRGAFARLRAKLDLCPGDARYATPRRP
jgi:tetratricopeptide (TPR) repeat protein